MRLLARSVGMRTIVLMLALPLAACVAPTPRARLVGPAPLFDAERFFVGRTHGDGMLTIVASRPRATHVDGIGQIETDGALRLDQHVETDGKPARDRRWRIRPLGGGRYGGTLSDADGPLVAQATGNCLHLRYSAKEHLSVEQWLYLQPDGKVALNRMVVRKFGIRVARLDETIRRVDQVE